MSEKVYKAGDPEYCGWSWIGYPCNLGKNHPGPHQSWAGGVLFAEWHGDGFIKRPAGYLCDPDRRRGCCGPSAAGEEAG